MKCKAENGQQKAHAGESIAEFLRLTASKDPRAALQCETPVKKSSISGTVSAARHCFHAAVNQSAGYWQTLFHPLHITNAFCSSRHAAADTCRAYAAQRAMLIRHLNEKTAALAGKIKISLIHRLPQAPLTFLLLPPAQTKTPSPRQPRSPRRTERRASQESRAQCSAPDRCR